jgi:hypothetical protein
LSWMAFTFFPSHIDPSKGQPKSKCSPHSHSPQTPMLFH